MVDKEPKEPKNITDILKTLNGETEVMSIERGTVNLVMIYDHKALVEKKERRITRLYKLKSDGESIEPIDVDLVIKTLVSKIKDGVNVSELLTEVFKKTSPDLLIETYSRLTQPKPKAVVAGSSTSRVGSGSFSHCCYSLFVEGEEGEKPLEIVINK
jgi:hypothetical protein